MCSRTYHRHYINMRWQRQTQNFMLTFWAGWAGGDFVRKAIFRHKQAIKRHVCPGSAAATWENRDSPTAKWPTETGLGSWPGQTRKPGQSLNWRRPCTLQPVCNCNSLLVPYHSDTTFDPNVRNSTRIPTHDSPDP